MAPEASDVENAPASDFSLVLGGPLFQFWRRTGLSGAKLELLGRRVLAATLLTWLPLLFLSALEGRAFGKTVTVPFMSDVEAHARFLIALPMLIAAEVMVYYWISPVVPHFLKPRIVRDEDLPKFDAAVRSTLRVLNSASAELVLLVLVYTLGLRMWRSHAGLDATWYATPEGGRFPLTLAGYWCQFVSIPVFQFILVRWYMRFGLWCRLLWKISRLNLHLMASHPDRAGGIGFIGHASCAFGPILFAQGALLSGMIADRVLYRGQSLLSFKIEAAGLMAATVLITLGPLLMFAPQLERAKRKGRAEYDLLGSRYVLEFEKKWIRRDAPDREEPIGTSGLQSLADLANSGDVVRDMRYVPFSLRDVSWLAAATAGPLLPLYLTTFSLEQLLTRLLQVLF